MSRLHALARLLQGRAPVDSAELRDYERQILPILRVFGASFARWRQTLELDSPQDELANAASIQRWEAVGLVDRLREIQPPRPLLRAHSDLAALAVDTARAAQRLSNGYRYNSSRTRCDGQALMLTCEARFEALCRTLSELGLAGVPSAPDAGGSTE